MNTPACVPRTSHWLFPGSGCCVSPDTCRAHSSPPQVLAYLLNEVPPMTLLKSVNLTFPLFSPGLKFYTALMAKATGSIRPKLLYYCRNGNLQQKRALQRPSSCLVPSAPSLPTHTLHTLGGGAHVLTHPWHCPPPHW